MQSTPEIDRLIAQLEAAMVKRYGGMFSYQISANHKLIACHNYRPDIHWPPKGK